MRRLNCIKTIIVYEGMELFVQKIWVTTNTSESNIIAVMVYEIETMQDALWCTVTIPKKKYQELGGRLLVLQASYLLLSPSASLYTVWLSIGSHSTETLETGRVTRTVGNARPAPAAWRTSRLASRIVNIISFLEQWKFDLVMEAFGIT